jgi:hypothetical protein
MTISKMTATTLYFLLTSPSAKGYSIPVKRRLDGLTRARAYSVPVKRRLGGFSRGSSSSSTSSSSGDSEKSWANWALLISSFAEGLVPNRQAKNFLRKGLIRALLVEDQMAIEGAVKTSAMHSPCCGPDLDLVDLLSEVDSALEEYGSHPNPTALLGEKQRVLRFVFIPTAMYALRQESENTPGSQRQRSRADGKKRRNEIVKLLQGLMGDSVRIEAVTLDLDDGSVKQPEGSSDPSVFPKSGKAALGDWNPHFIYVSGGNTFWLTHCVEKGDWAQDLIDACSGPTQAVYCGQSAGSILFGQSIETACWKGWDDPSIVPDMETYESWKGAEGLGLAGDLSVFPHYDEDKWENTVSEKEEDLSSEVYKISDADAYCIDGSAQTVTLTSSDDIKEPVSN